MNHTDKLTTAFLKISAEDFWNSGYTQPKGVPTADSAIFSNPGSKEIPKPKAVEPEGGQNRELGHTSPGPGAFNTAIWMSRHPGMVAGKGHGPEFTSGMSGEDFRA